jgi:hypothetical protein
VRALMPLVHAFGNRPASWSSRFGAKALVSSPLSYQSGLEPLTSALSEHSGHHSSPRRQHCPIMLSVTGPCTGLQRLQWCHAQ